MTLDQFWNIVDRVHQASAGDMEKKCGLLDSELRRLSLEELISWDNHFTDCFYRAYTWPLWAAAYIMGSGCSDDGFMDFRSTLISMGRQTYENALADPQSLADLSLEDGDELQYEGYQYVTQRIRQELTGSVVIPIYKPHPQEPAGKEWDESTVATLFPKLAARFNYQP